VHSFNEADRPQPLATNMPRGADYDDGVPRSDNAIEASEDKIHGAGKVSRKTNESNLLSFVSYADKVLNRPRMKLK
jgi:hypothetical protein